MCRVAGSAEFYVVCRVRYWLMAIKGPLDAPKLERRTVTVYVSVCVCTMIVLRMCTYIRSLFCVLKGHVSTPLGPLRRPL